MVEPRLPREPPERMSFSELVRTRSFWLVVAGFLLIAIVVSMSERTLVTLAWVIGGFALYFLPTLIARNKHNANSVAVINLFLGWTFIGWIIALAMAVNNPPAQQPVTVQQSKAAAVAERMCPFCAEEIKAAAVVCKHCGRDLPPQEE